MFVGVILFAAVGIKWQDRYGLKNVFRVFIIGGILLNLTSYALLDPWFSRTTGVIHSLLPGSDLGFIRWAYYAAFNFFVSIIASFIRMSTFSLVGAVIPINAAGSLFAGFMSVANLAYSFSYASGAWLYENGLNYGICRNVQGTVFGIPAHTGDKMSLALLIMIGTVSSLLSLLAVHMLPDKRHTNFTGDEDDTMIGPEHYRTVRPAGRLVANTVGLALGFSILAFTFARAIGELHGLHSLTLASVLVRTLEDTGYIIMAFFLGTFARKLILDRMYRAQCAKNAPPAPPSIS
jgi:hypothetical protein